MDLPLENIEGADFHDKLYMANNVSQITNTIGILQNIIAGIITIAGLAVVITRLDHIFILIVVANLSIKILLVYLTYKHNEKRRVLYAKNDRVGNYLNEISYFNQGAAKELRLNNLQSWFMGKIKGYRNEMLQLQYMDFKRYTLFESITAIIMAFQAFVILWLLSVRFIDGIINIADFAMYFTAVTVITTSLSSITQQIGEYNRQRLYLADFNMLKQINTVNDIHCPPIAKKPDITFENVSFSYPNTERMVLDNINLRIVNGEKLAVVGKNGAGKSTFIKLLCKFYHPTSGKISIGGVDIWRIPNAEYARLISAVFQDYMNFAFTLSENVSMNEIEDQEKSLKILCDIGLGGLVTNLPNGIDTFLSRSFDMNGVELSGGEGQKMAIARAVYKDTPVLILDEPTSSLDPRAESEIYDSFFKVAQNKTTIFISHRLAASTIADNIAVFADGKIIEYGSHTKLMKKNDVYAEMFRMQSKPYLDL